MNNLIPPNPNDNLLPYDGIVNDFGVIIDQDSLLYEDLLANLPWQSDKVTLFGKTHITKRQIVLMGEQPNTFDGSEQNQDGEQNKNSLRNKDIQQTLAYTYSGHTRQLNPWYEPVYRVKQQVEACLRTIGVEATFNTSLLNYYPTGMEGMGYHADDEPELGIAPIVVSVSLGATRKFVLKHKRTQHKVEIPLTSGQLIVMRGDTQMHWKHTVTKTKKVAEGRISLTFRHMLNYTKSEN